MRLSPNYHGLLDHARVVDDLPVDDCEDRADLPDLLVGNGEVVPVKDHQVCQLAAFDRADLVFHAQEPAVAARECTEGFLARDLLIAIDAVAERIDSGRREVYLQPRIQRRNMNSVAVDAGLDAVIDDRPEGRTYDDFRIIRCDPSESRHLNAAAERPKPVQQVIVDDRNVVDHPSQIGDVEFLVDLFVSLDHLRQAGQILHAVFVTPSGLRDEPLRFGPDGAAGEWRRPLANRAGHHQVIAEELELIPEAFL